MDLSIAVVSIFQDKEGFIDRLAADTFAKVSSTLRAIR